MKNSILYIFSAVALTLTSTAILGATGNICINCIGGNCAFIAKATNETSGQSISVTAGRTKALAVNPGDIITVKADAGSKIGTFSVLPVNQPISNNQVNINGTIRVGGTTYNHSYSIGFNDCNSK